MNRKEAGHVWSQLKSAIQQRELDEFRTTALG